MSKPVQTGFKIVMLASLAFGSGTSLADVSATANVGVASNYLWRGETQSADQAAVSGGLDVSQGDSGLYAGAWNSSLTEGEYEMDVYGGYKLDLGGVGVDLGLVRYNYPAEDNHADFSEVYVGASAGVFSVRVSYTDDYVHADESAYYGEIGVDLALKEDLALGLHAGWKEGDYFDENTDGGYADYAVSLSKGEFTFLVSNTDNDKYGQSDNPRIAVSWTHELDL